MAHIANKGPAALSIVIAALLALPLACGFTLAFQATRGREVCASASSSTLEGKKVLVTGAGGRTGRLVFQKLQALPEFQPIALVRSKKAADGLRKVAGATDEQIVLGDILEPESLKKAADGCYAVILCSSATPKIVFSSLAKIFLRKLFRQDPGRPLFTFPENGEPEQVDYRGAINQIDAAAVAGVKHFVFLGSMGGTQPENFLNTIGKRPDGTGGDILKWKRKAEIHLQEQAAKKGFAYTIVHPGGLIDKAGGQQSLVLDVDDALLARKTRSIPREDVAEVCVQALVHPAAKNKAFDCIAEAGEATKDFGRLFKTLGSKTCRYP